MSDKRAAARRLARRHLDRGDALGWFEALYESAERRANAIPWADVKVNPGLAEWLERARTGSRGEKALVIGCGLGDDAEYLAARGFDTVAFDVSRTAIAWCRERFPQSQVKYRVADLFELPRSYRGAFDFVFEGYTLQVLPPRLRRKAVREMAKCLRPGGRLLAVARGREPDEDEGAMPWPLTKDEMDCFVEAGLTQVSFEDYLDDEEPRVRRFRAHYRADSPVRA